MLPADPKAAYLAAQADIDAAIRRVLDSGRYILGPEVEAFEREFSAWLGAAGAVGVANGTDALELALATVGVGPGDRVATAANSVSATAAAITALGAVPVFCEVEPDTLLLDPDALAEVLRTVPGIKAVVPVHLYGHPCNLPRLLPLARAHGARVVEDCAQAHGAAVGGKRVGTWGDLAAFSFYPTKNLAALGDGGAVTGSDPALLEQVRLRRQYGWRNRYVSDGPGRNSRLDELQAAILRVQLPRLDAGNARRARLAARYLAGLRALQSAAATPATIRQLQLPTTAPDCTPVWHQFVVRSPQRDALQAHLARHDIHCGILYPVPLSAQPAFASPGTRAAGVPAHPVATRACAEVLSLPLHPGVGEADVDRVCGVLGEFR